MTYDPEHARTLSREEAIRYYMESLAVDEMTATNMADISHIVWAPDCIEVTDDAEGYPPVGQYPLRDAVRASPPDRSLPDPPRGTVGDSEDGAEEQSADRGADGDATGEPRLILPNAPPL